MNFEELESVLTLKQDGESCPDVDVRLESNIVHRLRDFPIYSFCFGTQDPSAPCIVLTGGVHGLEKIGTLILLSYLDTLLNLSTWDRSLKMMLERCRLVVIPIVNPVGMYLGKRSNGNDVDLMRNAPIDADTRPTFLVGGHRISRHLPWYRGKKNLPMEPESQAVADIVARECFGRPFSLVLDIHSGFGLNDRLWFPYAYTKKPFEDVEYVYLLKKLLNTSYPNNIYTIEPQTRHYVTNGDLWDHVFIESRKQGRTGPLLPLTLEIGSWSWIKKNPKQIFDVLGIYNPILPHRRRRAIRRHIWLIDFLLRAAFSYQDWAIRDIEEHRRIQALAVSHWY